MAEIIRKDFVFRNPGLRSILETHAKSGELEISDNGGSQDLFRRVRLRARLSESADKPPFMIELTEAENPALSQHNVSKASVFFRTDTGSVIRNVGLDADGTPIRLREPAITRSFGRTQWDDMVPIISFGPDGSRADTHSRTSSGFDINSNIRPVVSLAQMPTQIKFDSLVQSSIDGIPEYLKSGQRPNILDFSGK